MTKKRIFSLFIFCFLFVFSVAQSEEIKTFRVKAKFILLDSGSCQHKEHFGCDYLLLFKVKDTILCSNSESGYIVVRSSFLPESLTKQKYYELTLEKKFKIDVDKLVQLLSNDSLKFTVRDLGNKNDCPDYFLKEHNQFNYFLKSYK